MGTKCERCGTPLRQYRWFRNTCGGCGARFRSEPTPGWAWIDAMWGALAMLVIPAGLLYARDAWCAMVAIPALCVLPALLLSLRLQRWVPLES
jgi:hypothetical protein